ncbi:hypothetical protein ACFLQL_00670 [Verrucomicrobiota bacterium]
MPLDKTDYSKEVSQMTPQDLISETHDLFVDIRVTECYSTKDLRMFLACMEELHNRGYYTSIRNYADDIPELIIKKE